MIERIRSADYLGLGRKVAKPAKYGNRKVEIDGMTFDSVKEGRRYSQLKLLERAGEIRELELQVKYRLEVNGVHVCDYLADFVYEETVDRECGHRRFERVVEDVKGVRTKDYRIKAKLMKACHGITIRET